MQMLLVTLFIELRPPPTTRALLPLPLNSLTQFNLLSVAARGTFMDIRIFLPVSILHHTRALRLHQIAHVTRYTDTQAARRL